MRPRRLGSIECPAAADRLLCYARRSFASCPVLCPGRSTVGDRCQAAAKKHHSVLMANHGPVVSGRTLRDAQYATEELEETAKLFMILDGKSIRALSEEQVAEFTAEDH
ncbi:class II aldolase/adducin family protein (plasmid) [Rhizobium sp. RCAM05350]|uniref:class II aldolase/adducin family protein n=1 Tax=Rhizobium sp. RCAM05350 TaxID=2895568 RepID=UPI00207675BA|nr:class II aldolase/adducin family protein [Rhizobium sp. RCAM05350]URK89553.1 class II aldolase/adducin family protein [Rhizobium sp. RCAM05350]